MTHVSFCMKGGVELATIADIRKADGDVDRG